VVVKAGLLLMDADNRVVLNCGGIRHEVYKVKVKVAVFNAQIYRTDKFQDGKPRYCNKKQSIVPGNRRNKKNYKKSAVSWLP